MARLKSIKLSALNITLHPHKPADYVDLWGRLFDLRKYVDIGRDQAAMIGALEPAIPDEPLAGYVGLIYRFTVIDVNKGWFDLESGEEADQATVRKEIRIPPNLRPNLSTFMYRFFPRSHRLVVEHKNALGETLSPKSVEKMLDHLTADARIQDRFKSIDVTMEQSKEVIEDIITGRVLKRLTITVKRPNPDDDSDDDEKIVLGEMIREDVRTKVVDLQSMPGKGIKPSERTKSFVRVAASNGKVEATTETTDGKRVPVSSREHPRVEPVYYNPNKQDHGSAFLNAAGDFVSKLLGSGKSRSTDSRPPIV